MLGAADNLSRYKVILNNQNYWNAGQKAKKKGNGRMSGHSLSELIFQLLAVAMATSFKNYIDMLRCSGGPLSASLDETVFDAIQITTNKMSAHVLCDRGTRPVPSFPFIFRGDQMSYSDVSKWLSASL